MVERPFQETGAQQQVERPCDLREVVADVASELLTAEDDAGMPRKEEEQVEVARTPQTGHFNELHGQGVGRLNILDTGTPPGENPRAPRAMVRAETHSNAEIGGPQGLRSRWYRSCAFPPTLYVRMGLSGLQILVIEDAPDVLGMLTPLLRIEGADMVFARCADPRAHCGRSMRRRGRWDSVVTYLDGLSLGACRLTFLGSPSSVTPLFF